MADSSLSFLSQEIKEFEDFLKNYFKNRFQNESPVSTLKSSCALPHELTQENFQSLSQPCKKSQKQIQSTFQQKHQESTLNPIKQPLQPKTLQESVEYTVFSPGKRIRPALVIGACRILGGDYKKGFPLASAIELIHTASLIHDDLMDDDSQRRGRPSNHAVFGSDMALLAGDTLFMESFYLLCLFNQPQKLIQKTAELCSFEGMMGGQALDLTVSEKKLTLKTIQQIHRMKTGALIRLCLQGAGDLFINVEPEKSKALNEFGVCFGQAFQLADDLEDSSSGEALNILNTMDKKSALDQLNQWTKKSIQALNVFQKKDTLLRRLALFNQSRITS